MRASSMLAVIFLSIFLIFQSVTAFAEAKKKMPKTKKISAEKNEIPAFDLTREALPLAFSGHNLMKLYKGLSERKEVVKSEFETTEQFDARFANELKKPFLGKLTVYDTYAFMVRPTVEYDADNKSLKFKLGATTIKELGSHSYENTGFVDIVTKRSEKQNGSFRGTNAYGASIKVLSSSTVIESLALKDNLSLFEPAIQSHKNTELSPIKRPMTYSVISVL